MSDRVAVLLADPVIREMAGELRESGTDLDFCMRDDGTPTLHFTLHCNGEFGPRHPEGWAQISRGGVSAAVLALARGEELTAGGGRFVIEPRRELLSVRAGRQGGKTAAARRAIYDARDRGEHVHIAGGKGEFCAAREQPADCHAPRWEGLRP